MSVYTVALLILLVLGGCRGADVAQVSAQPSETPVPVSSPSAPQGLQELLDRLGQLWEFAASDQYLTVEQRSSFRLMVRRVKEGLQSEKSGQSQELGLQLVGLLEKELEDDEKLNDLIEPLLVLEESDPDAYQKEAEKARPLILALIEEQEARKLQFDKTYHRLIALGEVEPFVPHGGVVGLEAPEWRVEQWRYWTGNKPPQVTDYRGRVLVLYCFQAWCPGCHDTGFPTIKRLYERYKDNDKVAFVVVQTVFEGFEQNSIQRGAAVMREFGLECPMGHDPGPDDSGSTLMKDYRQAGTPWIVLIDPDGMVRFNDYKIETEKAASMIEDMLFKKLH